MVELTYWPKRIFYLSICFFYKITLTAIYWRKKKCVPLIRDQILFKSANKLALEIREKKLKSEDVIRAYIDRIREVEPYINAVVQDNFRGALEEAKEVDTLIESGNFTFEQLLRDKPLLGVPFTVKCLLKVKGFQSSGGSVILKDRIAEDDSPTVKLLKKAGGIFLALTNSPEFGSALETVNKLHGKTCNPYDVSKTCGGSSGGEAALLAAAGSIIGLGNDLFGSVRIPSHFCGLFAHKATTSWISNEGTFVKCIPVLKTVLSTGPMCRYSEDLITMVKVLSKNKKEMNMLQKVDFKSLKIYYQTGIEHAWIPDTDKEIVTAVQNAAYYFKKQYGAEVKEIKIPLLSKASTIISHAYQSRIPNLTESITDGKVKHLNGVVELIKMLFGKCKFTFSAIFALCFGKCIFFYNKNHVPDCERMKAELENEFNKLLDKHSLFICPTLPTTAPYHRETIVVSTGFCYTGVFNMLGMPATQCPIGLSKTGLPLGIQIVGHKGNDALSLAAAVELEKAYGGWIPP